MITNPMMWVAWAMLFVVVGWVATHVRIKRVNVNVADENCPPELKEAFYKKHPGAKWLTDYLNSVKKFDARLDESAEKVKNNEKSQFLQDMEMIMVISTGKTLIGQNLDKIKKFTPRKADRVLRKYGSANAATEAMFGDFVEDFLFTSFVLDAFEESEDFKPAAEHDKIFAEAKKRAHEMRIKNAA